MVDAFINLQHTIIVVVLMTLCSIATKIKARRLIEQESFVNNRTIGVSVVVNKKSSLLDFE